MKLIEVKTTKEGVLYQLETPQIFKSDCVSFDDSEVDHKNASDTIESCRETSYSHLFRRTTKSYDLYFPADSEGKLINNYPILSYPSGKVDEAVIKLYGPAVSIEKINSETTSHSCYYDAWHPDHKI